MPGEQFTQLRQPFTRAGTHKNPLQPPGGFLRCGGHCAALAAPRHADHLPGSLRLVEPAHERARHRAHRLSPDQGLPGILFTRPKACDQVCVAWSMDLFSSEQVFVFMLSPIVIYLPLIVNGEFFFTCCIYTTSKKTVNWMRVTDSNCRCTWLMRPVW